MGAVAQRRPGALSQEPVSLCETLDRVLNKGVVVAGEVLISVAGVDLIYLGVQLTLTSAETIRQIGVSVRPALAPEIAAQDHG